MSTEQSFVLIKVCTFLNSGEKIYNDYLRALGDASGRGYKKRLDFSNLKDEEKNCIIRLELFFKNNKVYPYDFFKASFKYTEDKYLPLDFFLTRKSIAYWNKISHTNLTVNPDSESSLLSFKDGIKFIVSFLSKHKKKVSSYESMINNHGVPMWLLHLKEQKISFYHIHALGINTNINSIKDYKDLVIYEFDKKLQTTRQAYFMSTELKKIGDKLKAYKNV